jgi:hypothetical protein
MLSPAHAKLALRLVVLSCISCPHSEQWQLRVSCLLLPGASQRMLHKASDHAVPIRLRAPMNVERVRIAAELTVTPQKGDPFTVSVGPFPLADLAVGKVWSGAVPLPMERFATPAQIAIQVTVYAPDGRRLVDLAADCGLE